MKNLGDFQFFIGVVEDIHDPKKLNRVRIRAHGIHTESKADVPTDKLPWAPIQHGSAQMSAPMILPGCWCFGIYLDGETAQHPLIIGFWDQMPKEKPDKSLGFSDPAGIYPKSAPGKPTNSPLARGETANTPSEYTKKTVAPGEPPSMYAPTYPTNHVLHTDMDNIIELDDTPGKERVHIFHRSGSFIEFHPDGKVVVRSLKDMYEAVFANKTMYVAGNLKIQVAGNADINSTGNMSLTSKGNMTITAGGNLSATAKGTTNIGGGSDVNVAGSGTTSINGSSVHLGEGSVSAGSAPNVEKKTCDPYKAPGTPAK
jgi:hypothetical protein